ncbi:MAG: phage holin family protein [Microgenomates group bacterium]
MRKIILNILATAASFYLAQYFLAGIHLDSTWSAYLIASLVFVVFNFVLSPIIKLLLLPINLLTLGLFRWLTNVLVLYLFDLIYDGIAISGFTFPGYTSSIISIPSGYLGLFWVLVLASFIMSLTYSFITTLFTPGD